MKFDVIAQEWFHSKVPCLLIINNFAAIFCLTGKTWMWSHSKRMMRSYSSAKSFKKACR